VAAGRSATDESQPLDFHSPYGCSKGAADQYVRDYARIYGLHSVVFRMSCIAGPRQFGSEDQGWVAHFLYSALEGKPITIYGDGRQVRDILYVEDLLRAFEAAYANREHTAGQIYNIGGGQQNTISLLELMDRMEQLTGVPTNRTFGNQRAGDQLIYITDHGKFSRHTGWQPRVSLDGIVNGICNWYRSHHQLFASAHAEHLGQLELLVPARRTA
jgi:CDP-paratose 2-epimerase